MRRKRTAYFGICSLIQKKSTMSNGKPMDSSLWSHLPPDIVANVLVRLPLKSLWRFKCVSPIMEIPDLFPSILPNPPSHKQLNTTRNKPPKTLLRSSSNALYSVDLTDANPTAEKLVSLSAEQFGDCFMVSKPCSGLLLVYGKCYDSNFLLNPFTCECKKLPVSHSFEHSVRGFSYDSSMDDYKVVMVSNPPLEDEVGTDVAVYSLKTDAWSRIQVSHDWLELETGVYLNDRLHWLCLDNAMIVAAFNLSDQIFREIQLPEYNLYSDHLEVLRGCLCLVCFPYSGCKVELWMMTKYGVTESWTKFTIANPRMYINCVLCLLAEDKFVLSTRGRMVDVNGDIVVDESHTNQLLLCNPEKETVRVMIVPGIPTIFFIFG